MNSISVKIRRITSLFLAMLLGASLAVTASAKRFDDVKEYAEQIDILSDIGIIVGTSEDEFSPDEKVTREQMALMLFRTMLGRNNAGTSNSTAFTDLYDSTYHGAISWANAAGYIIGTSDTTFEPTGGITLQDAMTMIVRALGQSNKAMDSGYPWTYIDAAVKLGLDDGLEKVDYEKTLTRAETAAILYNALTAEYLVPKTASGSYVVQTTIIEYVFGYEIEDCTVVATNDYTIENFAKTVKDGYITLLTEGKSAMTVSFADTGLEGEANDWLGRTVKVIYKLDGKTKNIEVFGASYTGTSSVTADIKVASGNTHVTIGGTRYNIVSEKSASNATNENELYLYYFDDDGKLGKFENNAQLAEKLGYGEITLIGEYGKAASIGLFKPFSFNRFDISYQGNINIAGNLTAQQLGEGFSNTANAENGDYVLYYYNSENRELEIREKIAPIVSELVTKLTADSAVVGGQSYSLGNSKLGISANDIASKLNVGSKASIIAKDGRILAVLGATVVKTEGKYLVPTTTPVPVYLDGYVRYAFTANIDGKDTSVVSNTYGIEAGKVYRYTVDGNGVYTLYDYSAPSFTVNDDLAVKSEYAESTVLGMGTAPYFTVGGTKFVTDENTVIVVRGENGFTFKKGIYTADITLSAGAKITAIFHNNTGDVETLSYMFIDGGVLGRTDISTNYVKVLEKIGHEYIGSTVYTTYKALNLTNGKIENFNSISASLELGKVYALDNSSFITDSASSLVSGILNGYTASTVTVGEETYRLGTSAAIVWLNSDNTSSKAYLNDLTGRAVNCFILGNEVVAIIG